MGQQKTINAETLLKVAQAGVALRALGWPDEFIIKILSPLVPGLDSEGLIAAMAAVKESAGRDRPDSTGRGVNKSDSLCDTAGLRR